MNPRQAWTSSLPRLASRYALSLLLAAGAGCAEDLALDRGGRLEDLNQSRGGAAHADAGAASDAPPNAVSEGEYARPPQPAPGRPPQPEPGRPPQAEPGNGPQPQPGISCPPRPVEADAGLGVGGGRPVRDCFDHRVGDGKTCISDVDLALQGERLCQARGFALTALKLGEADCAGGSTEGSVSCCAPDAPSGSGACIGGVIGDGSACIDWASLELEASGECEALGLSLHGLAGSSDDRCPNGVRQAKYQCCESDAPPRPYDPRANPG